MSDNWVVQNLENALETWNGKLSEIWQLITESPQNFRGGAIWNVIVNIHGALQAVGLALLVLFFVVGVMKTCGSFAEVKKPEHALKLFIRFAIAKGLITYGMELMLSLLQIVQGVISTIMNSAGFGSPQSTVLPAEIVTAISNEQMSYITNADAGCGLIKYGSALVPFVNRFPKDTKLYQLMTTRPGEGVFAQGQVS